jgi:hypothetical protein
MIIYLKTPFKARFKEKNNSKFGARMPRKY